ncbi:hypothetical protein MLD38_026177 [Melastoma candidum]|uniref:Uncharacterized protein n=1 Tax=Melastoma candidum TaxID=119954 RepID=A0ACB9NYR7_9MYRT|nr:hypothetical protein MLD38_026177 [Melastoma candidum]
MALREAIFARTSLNYHSFIPATILDACLCSTLPTPVVSAHGLSRRCQQASSTCSSCSGLVIVAILLLL